MLQLVPDEIWVPQRRPKILILCSAVPASSPPLHTLACSTTNWALFSKKSHASGLTPARFHTFVLPACTWMRACPKVHFQAVCEPYQLWRDCRQFRYCPRMQTAIPLVSIVGALLQGLGVGQGRTKEASLHPLALHPHLGPPHSCTVPISSSHQYVDGLP